MKDKANNQYKEQAMSLFNDMDMYTSLYATELVQLISLISLS
jgi:hypothetical protein